MDERGKSMNGAKGKRSVSPSFLAFDFFSGAGGTTRGLIDAGGYVIAGIDHEASCEETYTKNNKNATLDRKYARFLNYDIFPKTKEHPNGQQKPLLKEIESLISEYGPTAGGNVPLFFAICAPCQPFTRLAKKELTDKRKKQRQRDSSLLLEACKFVKRFRPEIVLSENVAGISGEKFGGVWEDFRKRLIKLGYTTGTKIVCTSKFGIPQYRRRSILLAVRKEYLKPERVKNMMRSEIMVPESDPDALIMTVQEAIGHLPKLEAGMSDDSVPNHRTRCLSDLNYRRLSVAKPGESNKYLEYTKYGNLSLRCHRKAEAKHRQRCFTDVYTRMHPNRPSPTITTKCHSVSNGRFGHYDTKQIRGISLREAAILQSFPEHYIFYKDKSLETVARMIGNAVPPKLASFYARYLAESVTTGPSHSVV